MRILDKKLETTGVERLKLDRYRPPAPVAEWGPYLRVTAMAIESFGCRGSGFRVATPSCRDASGDVMC